MAKTKKTPKNRDTASKPEAPSEAPAKSHAVRETIESIVIAFVLAFLFRTFQAEAFVIPTGSMAPTLMGRHQDVFCSQCDFRFQLSASEQEGAETIAGRCPMCRYVMPMQSGLPLPDGRRTNVPYQPPFNGDRILVNKYLYTVSEPQRWDVAVFKYPGDAKINYIKRLVGLPGETLRIYHGNLFVGPPGASDDEDFEIARKPPDKVLALRQPVHDTHYDPAELDEAGWPLRWHAADGGGSDDWQVEKSVVGPNVRQRYHVDRERDDVAWLRYEHVVPDYRSVWLRLRQTDDHPSAEQPPLFADLDRSEWRKLITDANPYNARQDSRRLFEERMVAIDRARTGLHWVGDLMLEANVEIEAARGELLLDLVKAGRHFTCTIDLASGQAQLAVEGAPQYAPTAGTPLNRAGKFRLGFANVDDQLILWVDGKVIRFDAPTQYDANAIYGNRREIIPQSSPHDLGDLAPAGVGARNTRVAVTRLQLWRDIYYIAHDWRHLGGGGLISDYDPPMDLTALFYDPTRWDAFATRRQIDFPLVEDQFFVLGDNGAESSDARLWLGDPARVGRAGGAYMERKLLIGKALCVYWPHSWNRIPGTRIPFPMFPNFADMRLVR